MGNINIELNNSNVAENDSQLFSLLRGKSKSTSVFQEAIDTFLNDFNEKYDTSVSFSQVLSIYNNKNDLEISQSIILCKALLDFIQTNGIEVTFKGKTYLLRYDTLASTNIALEYNPMSKNEIEILSSLSSSISSFISQLREYFRFLIPDNTSLRDANIDNVFSKVPGMKREESTVVVHDGEKEDQVKTFSGSIKIAPGFVMNCELSEPQLKEKIVRLDNARLRAFLNYLYEKMPYSPKKKHLVLAKYLFKSYDAAAGQTIRRVLEGDSKFRMATMNKINVKKLKKLLFSDIAELDEASVAASDDNNEQDEAFDVYMANNILYLSEFIWINLSDDESFYSSLIKISRENTQRFFSVLEEIVIRKYNITQRYSAAKICELIQKSEDPKVETNVRQKITSLRAKPSLITAKFLNNNVDVSNLRKLICEDGSYLTKGEVEANIEEGDNIDTSESPEIKRQTFRFEFPKDADADETVSFDIEFDGKKNLNGFIGALNSFIAQESERQDMSGAINTFSINDFKDTKLDSAFFDNINRQLEDTYILDMFGIIDQKDLELFLSEWHKAVGKKMIISKKVYIEPGSREELWDFVFNVWQKKVDTKVKKEIRRRSTSQAGLANKKRSSTRITKDMFEGIESLTLELADKIASDKRFKNILNRIHKNDLKALIQDYLSSRK